MEPHFPSTKTIKKKRFSIAHFTEVVDVNLCRAYQQTSIEDRENLVPVVVFWQNVKNKFNAVEGVGNPCTVKQLTAHFRIIQRDTEVFVRCWTKVWRTWPSSVDFEPFSIVRQNFINMQYQLFKFEHCWGF